MKTLIKLAIVLVVLVFLGGLAVFIYIDSIAKAGVERAATFALGVQTSVDSVDMQVFAGEVELEDLLVANPEGFDAPHFLDLDEGTVKVTLGTLRKDVVEVPHLALEELDLHLQQRGSKGNYRVILDNLKRFETKGREAKVEKLFVVQQVDIRNLAIHVEAVPGGGRLTAVDVPIEHVQLHDVGEGDPRGVTLGELTSIIIKAVVAAVIEQAGDRIPTDLLTDLQGQLAKLQSLDQLGITVLAGSGEQLEKVIGDFDQLKGEIQEKVRGAGDIGKQAEDLLKGAGGILGGEREEREERDGGQDEEGEEPDGRQ